MRSHMPAVLASAGASSSGAEEESDLEEDDDEEVDELDATSSEDEEEEERKERNGKAPARPQSPPVVFEPSEDEGPGGAGPGPSTASSKKGKGPVRHVRKPGGSLIPEDTLNAILGAERTYSVSLLPRQNICS
jgi:hypothetical protein